jgi:dGTP triphosphohydrolase
MGRPKKVKSDEGEAKPQAAGDVRVGEPVKRAVKVKINVIECAEKEAEVVKLEIRVKRIQLKMSPLKKEITQLNKKIDQLCADVDDSSEERTILVRDEFHYNQNMVRTIRADDGTVIDERTMEASEAQHDLTQMVADMAPKKRGRPKGSRNAVNPAFQAAAEASDAQDLTPGEAIAAARAELDDVSEPEATA